MPESKSQSTPQPSPHKRRWLARALKAIATWPVELVRPLAICAVSGALLAFAFPRWDFAWLVWAALVPVFPALWFLVPGDGWRRALKSALCGWCAGCAFFLSSLFWITEVSGLGWIAVGSYLGLYFAAWAAIVGSVARPKFHLFKKRTEDAAQSWSQKMFATSADSLSVAILCASAWTALEWVRSWMFTGFGWNGLGVALHQNLVLIQIADIVGVTGISFFVMLAISTIATTAIRLFYEVRHARIRPHADFFIVIAVFMGLFFYGTEKIQQHAPTKTENSESLKCLVIQPNVDQEVKWEKLYATDILNKFYDATEVGTDAETALVVWPETAIPYDLNSLTTEDYVNDVLGLGNFALVLGINDIQFQPDDERVDYNAMALFKGDYASVRVYRKIHLVPFGEYIPLRRSFPPFEWIAGSEITGDFSRGTDAVPLLLPRSNPDSPTEIIPLICFEDTIGELARQFISPHAQLMVTVTNNGWFNQSANSVQHVANAKFRCIELRRPMLRSANTGITCHIEPTGRIAARIDPGIPGDFTLPADFLISQVTITAQEAPTFYASHGDLFSKVLAGITALWVIGYCLHRRRFRRLQTNAA
ncbi:MAG: apolipoprotein N-acyltransferase [Verrucomicrobiales bacterium]|jgi:apolipoprotein N-acyltransferase